MADDLLIRMRVAGAPKAKADLDKVDGSIKRVGRSAAGLAAGAGGAIAITAALKSGATTALDFETVMAEVKAITGSAGDELDALKQAALDLGASSGLGPTATAEAIAELAKGGLEGKVAMDALGGTVNLAQAGAMGLSEAAVAAVEALGLFNLEGTDAAHVADAYAMAANATTADVEDFTAAMATGGAAAKAAGLDFDQTLVALEAMADIGIKGSSAGSSMKSFFNSIAKPSAESEALMKKLGISFFDAEGKMKNMSEISGMLQESFAGMTQQQKLSAATTIAGSYGQRSLLALYESTPDKLSEYAAGLAKQGTAAQVAATKTDTLRGMLNRAKAAVDAFVITHLTPWLRAAAKAIGWVVKAIGKMIGVVGTLSPLIAGLAVALAVLNARVIASNIAFGLFAVKYAVVTTATTAYTAAQWLLNAALTANPIGLLIAALAGLAVGFAVLWKRSETFRNVITGVWNTVKKAFTDAYNWIKRQVELMKLGWEGLKIKARNIASDIRDKFNSVVDFFKKMPGRIGNAVKGLWNGLKDSFKSAVNWIIDKWNNFELKIGGGKMPITGVSIPSVTLSTPDIPRLYTGGEIERGGWAQVGELGPELVRLPGGSTVYDAEQTAAAKAGAGGGTVRLELVGGTVETRAAVRTMWDLFVAHGEYRAAHS